MDAGADQLLAFLFLPLLLRGGFQPYKFLPEVKGHKSFLILKLMLRKMMRLLRTIRYLRPEQFLTIVVQVISSYTEFVSRSNLRPLQVGGFIRKAITFSSWALDFCFLNEERNSLR